MAEDTKNIIVKLENVRLSFPSLFKPTGFQGQEPKYGAQFLILKNDSKNIDVIKQAIRDILVANNKGKKLSSDKYCLHDGEEKDELDGYGSDVMFVSASSKKRPLVVNRDNSTLEESDDVIYAGCYVDCTMNIWWQNHPQYGKRVNAQLRAVRYRGPGEAFGSGPRDPDSEFGDALDEGTLPDDGSLEDDDVI